MKSRNKKKSSSGKTILSKQREDQSTKVVIKGERVFRSGNRQSITLEIREDFITLWSRQVTAAAQEGEVFIYIFHRQDKNIWCGNISEGSKRVGKIVEPHKKEYLCVLNSLKSYIGDLFLLKPHDLTILGILEELEPRSDEIDNFLNVLFKLVRND